jgi:hypothetical protein
MSLLTIPATIGQKVKKLSLANDEYTYVLSALYEFADLVGGGKPSETRPHDENLVSRTPRSEASPRQRTVAWD